MAQSYLLVICIWAGLGYVYGLQPMKPNQEIVHEALHLGRLISERPTP